MIAVRKNSLTRISLVALMFIWLLAGARGGDGEAWAKVYKWVDTNGRLHFSNTPPPKGSARDLEIRHEAPPVRTAPRRPASKRNVAVNFERNGAAIIVPAVVNQRYPAKFIVDTGATYTVISKEFARRMRIDLEETKGTVTLQTANGAITTPLISLDSLRVKGAEVRDVITAVHSFNSNEDVVGLLGLSFLNAFRVTIDNEQGRIYLKKRP